jgi:hypothetical protein
MKARRRFKRSLVLGLALAALGSTAAQAATRPDDRAGRLGVGTPGAAQTSAIRLDDRAGPLGVGTDIVSQHIVNHPATGPATGESKNEAPFVAEAGAGNSTRLSQASPVERIIAQERGRHGDARIFGSSEPASVQIVQAPGGFDWGDAAVGGAATLALVLLLAGAAVLHLDSRRQEAHG